MSTCTCISDHTHSRGEVQLLKQCSQVVDEVSTLADHPEEEGEEEEEEEEKCE